MEHKVAVGDVLAIWGTRDTDGMERQYVIREHGEIGTTGCAREGAHLHLVEITILVTGYVSVTDVHLGDALIIGEISHRWTIHASVAGFVLVPAS